MTLVFDGALLKLIQEDLDREPTLRGRPISLVRVDGHASWVSSRVLELMGDLPDKVEGGDIVRYANGNPTGEMHNNYILGDGLNHCQVSWSIMRCFSSRNLLGRRGKCKNTSTWL